MKTLEKHIIFSLLVITAACFTSCENLWDKCVEGDGNRSLEDRPLQSFSSIEVNGEFDVRIDTGSTHSVTIEADENLLDLINTRVSGDKLIIETRNHYCLQPTHPVEITVTAGEINEIALNGSGFVYCYGLETPEISVRLSGSGQIDCDHLVTTVTDIVLEGSGLINCNVTTERLTDRLEGSGEIKFTGACIDAGHRIIGSGKIRANQLNTDVCEVYISGSGIAETYVNSALNVTIIGSGIVYYTGNPSVESDISGSGKVVER